MGWDAAGEGPRVVRGRKESDASESASDSSSESMNGRLVSEARGTVCTGTGAGGMTGSGATKSALLELMSLITFIYGDR